jgi:hypothetical protein
MAGKIGVVRKKETTEIVVEKSGHKGPGRINIRDDMTSERYTGRFKSGLRISDDKWKEFKAILYKVDNA